MVVSMLIMSSFHFVHIMASIINSQFPTLHNKIALLNKNRTLMDATCSMLQVASLPNSYLEAALATTCYLQNRSYNSTLGNHTPYECWNGQPPDLSHRRIFGCLAYKYIPSTLHNKLDPRTERTIFVGYGERFGMKSYHLFNQMTQKFTFSRNVIFN